MAARATFGSRREMGSGQNGKWVGARPQRCRLVDKTPTGRQRVPTLTEASRAKRGNPVWISAPENRRRVGAP